MNLRQEFRTEAEDELWHLISKSKTYDEVAELWRSLVQDQEIVEKLKKKKVELEKLLAPLSFEEQAQTLGPFAALGVIKEILEISE